MGRTLLCACLLLPLAGCATTSPLLTAAARGDNESVRSLIEAGAPVDPESCRTITTCDKPLIEAAKNGRIDTVRLLLRAGASPFTLDGRSLSARQYAEQNGFSKIAQLLEAAEALDKVQEEGQAAVSAEDVAKIVAAALDAEQGPAAPRVVSDADQPGYLKPEDPDAAAIVIGVERYAELPEAPFAERDAAAVRAHLLALGFAKRNVVFATNEQVTKAGLAKYVEAWLPKRASARSLVFFYFAGYGAPELKTGRAFLMPSDGDPRYLRLSGYPLDQLYRKLAQLPARRMVVALDCGFTGAGGRSALAPGTRPLLTRIDLGEAADPRIVTIAAAGPEQVSGALPEQGHGLFTYYFLKGLNADPGEKGRVTLQSLYDFLLPRVRDAARREGRDQAPRLWPPGEAAAVLLR